MALEEYWLTDEEYKRKFEYLDYAFSKLELDLFSSFELLPLRKSNLDVSSMFFADICLRVYPLLTIGFNAVTFGNKMKKNIDNWTIQKKVEGFSQFYRHVDLEAIKQCIIELGEKNKENEDGIRDYYKFYKRDDIGIEEYLKIKKVISAKHRLGRIEYKEITCPFETKPFNKYLDTRNSIEHRGRMEATQRDAFNAVGSLFIIMEKFSTGKYHHISSNIFIDKFDRRMGRV